MGDITREMELKAAILAAKLTSSDFRVYMTLLSIAEFKTAEIPDKFQPRSLVKLAEKCRVSYRTLCYSLSHLQMHGWLERDRDISENGTIGGRGHATRYGLLLGQDCDCKQSHFCTVSAPDPVSEDTAKQCNGGTVYEEKQCKDVNTFSAATICESAGQTARPAERAMRGREKRGSVSAQRIALIVRQPRWGGGLHREHLAEILKTDPHGKEFVSALMVAYKAKRIDFCGQYVVATVAPIEGGLITNG